MGKDTEYIQKMVKRLGFNEEYTSKLEGLAALKAKLDTYGIHDLSMFCVGFGHSLNIKLPSHDQTWSKDKYIEKIMETIINYLIEQKLLTPDDTQTPGFKTSPFSNQFINYNKN